MSTGALQHLLLRLRRWWMVRDMRARRAQLEMLVDNLSADVAQDMLILIDMRQELQHVTRQLRIIERSMASARAPGTAEA